MLDLNDRSTSSPPRRPPKGAILRPATLTKFIIAWHWPSSPEHQAAGTITV
jgi:hypothetical protein